ncbi:MAG: hypothetical protein WCC12_05525 [Anaerolineales bacterium]
MFRQLGTAAVGGGADVEVEVAAGTIIETGVRVAVGGLYGTGVFVGSGDEVAVAALNQGKLKNGCGDGVAVGAAGTIVPPAGTIDVGVTYAKVGTSGRFVTGAGL